MPGHIAFYWVAGCALGVLNGLFDWLPTVPTLVLGLAGATLLTLDWLRFAKDRVGMRPTDMADRAPLRVRLKEWGEAAWVWAKLGALGFGFVNGDAVVDLAQKVT